MPDQHTRSDQQPRCGSGSSHHLGHHRVLANEALAPGVHRLLVHAPRIAEIARPGQFVIVHLGDGAERIPLTIAGRHPDDGAISLVVQAVGKSTGDLVALEPGASIHDLAGPLGRPTDLVAGGTAVCVAGGVGAAVASPIAEGLADLGTRVVTVLGARTADALVLVDELGSVGELVVCTDDGTAGRRGLVTDALTDLLAERVFDVVYVAGPVPMMRAVADVTRQHAVPTLASLNPIMVDGTGMCGGCRVSVGGEMRFACVDGPEFDAHRVDFDELADRLATYRTFEREAAAPRRTS